MNTALLDTLIGAAALLAGTGLPALIRGLTGRRAAGGRIGTSTAEVLWEQAQVMRAELVAQRDKAMEQRDRLIDAQSAQLGAGLAAIGESLREISGALARLESRDD